MTKDKRLEEEEEEEEEVLLLDAGGERSVSWAQLSWCESCWCVSYEMVYGRTLYKSAWLNHFLRTLYNVLRLLSARHGPSSDPWGTPLDDRSKPITTDVCFGWKDG